MIRVLIQAEAGSLEKRVYDERTLEYRDTKHIARSYPYPYGFIIGTSATDGGCVDCYLITHDPLKAGTIVECHPVALLHQEEAGEPDHKVLAAIPGQDVAAGQELLQELQDFIAAIFATTPEVGVRVGPILPREAAQQHIQDASR